MTWKEKKEGRERRGVGGKEISECNVMLGGFLNLKKGNAGKGKVQKKIGRERRTVVK